MILERLEGWEGRLLDVVAEAEGWTYQLGVQDCFRFACLAVQALTGVDRWPEFMGYRTRREAAALLAKHGSNFEAAFDWFFGAGTRVDWKLARRGDILAWADESGEKHLLVCEGLSAVGLLEAGIVRKSKRLCHCAWRVG